MTCAWQAKLDRYVDSELSGSELTQMEAHLRGCPACAADALSRLQLKRVTQAAARRFSATPAFRLKIENSIGQANASRWKWRWTPAFAAAAALVLVLISAGVWLQRARGEQALGELADLHVATLASANPVDVVSTDRHTVKPWFQGKLPFSFILPELQNSPFKLIGGRVAYFQQNPGAQLLFEFGKHRISVFIFQNRAELGRLDSVSALRSKLSFNSETWVQGGLRYFIVGDANAADVHRLGELLKSAARS
ncbi:MAG: zf-HC2 domain-containing protein [Bryobacteraceae bacterium]|jgi:anti-sigma factor RsiW